MIVRYALLLFCLLFLSCATDVKTRLYNEGINLTPKPLEMKVKEGKVKLSSEFSFWVRNESLEPVVSYFAVKIKRATGYELEVKDSKPEAFYIEINIEEGLSVNDEGYLLDVNAENIRLRAKTPQGIFYGMQTFMQLLPAEIESYSIRKGINWNIPLVEIKDEPRFSYRGMHLDVCRHFADVDFIKKQLEVLALFKINKFHWHLTDDQGWRIEIKQYPELTRKGSVRTEGEGDVYGPYFYTQEEVREVVAYAKERFIEVIPEIELPGHAVAAIAAYPDLSCRGKQIPVRNMWGVANDVFCAGNEQSFEFLENVLEEVMPLFESDYFHIGGDECPKIRWKECPKCQTRIRELGLKTDSNHSAEEKLQSYFVQRVEKFLLKNNKKMIGWDEILEGGLASSATVMSWRGEEGGVIAATMGHDVVMTPGGWFYMDRYQGDPKILPVTIGGSLTLKKIYEYNPLPKGLEDSKEYHILGAQCNVWTEYKYKEEDVEHDIYPRIIALAEMTWTPQEKREYVDFEKRIDNQRVRLDMHSVNYYIPLPEQKGVPSCDFIAFTNQVTLDFETTEPVKMVYTVDGKDPHQNSKHYSEALTFTESAVLKIRSVLLSGKMSPVRTIRLIKQQYMPAVEKVEREKEGLKAEYYKGYIRTVAELENRLADEIEYVEAPQKTKYRIRNYREAYDEDFYTTVLTGYINIKEDGVYYFSTDYELWLDGQLLISNEKDNQGTARRFSRSDRSISLKQGYHAIKIIRLGAIFGGWPTQWDVMLLHMRKEGENQFRRLDKSDFI